MTLDEQKEAMLEMLIVFAKYCDNHNLTYYLDAGTLIGAVRHKGFIPWDDDVDVNMPQIDYDRFCNLMQQQDYHLDEHIIVELPGKQVHTSMKIIDTRTTLIEYPDSNPQEVGVYLDIFTKYGIKDKSFWSRSACKISEILNLIHWFNTYSVNAWQQNGSSWYRKAIAVIGKAITWSPGWAAKLQDQYMHYYAKKHPLHKCKYVTTLSNGEFHKLAPKECFDGYQMLEFEGHLFKGPKDYDTYLRCLYKGDYMQLPPVDKQIHHTTIVYWK